MGKIIVVGAGFSGSVIAREIAEKLDREVIVVDKRNHIAGNMYDEVDSHGISIHKYGPHVLVTNRWSIIKYLSRFSVLYKHTVKELSFIDGQYIRLPFNFESVQQLIGGEKAESLINKLRKEFAGEDRVAVLRLVNNTDEEIAWFGNLLFEKAYRTYCAKQWDVPVESLGKEILERVPMAMNYDERYMNKDFQYLPLNGYEALFKNMLTHKNIIVRLGEDALDHIKLDDVSNEVYYNNQKVDLLVFTGAIDELFNEKYGELPYRSLKIDYDWFAEYRIYPEEIISYPQAKGYTRKTEYKFMMNSCDNCIGTTVATEYPVAYEKEKGLSPFYPVITEENLNRHKLYKQEAAKYCNIFLSGRLADFKYYNMDDCIIHAFEVFEEIRKYITVKECE